MLIFFYLVFVRLIVAQINNTSIIYIHEELPPSSLLSTSISSTSSIQWLPSSYSYQTYFHLNPNQSLYTTDQRIDREEFCERNLCNCSYCVLNLNFLQTFSTNNISIRTIQIVIEGRTTFFFNFSISSIQFRYQRSFANIQTISIKTPDCRKRAHWL